MSWYLPAEIAQLTLTFVLFLVFSFLYWHDKEKYLLLWALSWLSWSIKYIFDILFYFSPANKFFLLCNLLSWLAAGILLAVGTLVFAKKPFRVIWRYSAFFLFMWIIILTNITSSLPLLIFPIFFFLGMLFIFTGINFIRSQETDVKGKYITGWIFILSGLHTADYPILSPIEWFAPWGYLTAGILLYLLASSTLLVYYQKIRKDLSNSEERFRLLAENAKDVIFRIIFKPTPFVDYISPSVKEITGYMCEELYSNPRLFLSLEYPDEKILKWVRKDGQVIWVEQNTTGILDKKGDLIGLEGIIRDITERKKSEDKILELEKSRRDLLTNISHELRTPITSIQGYVEALMDGIAETKEEQKKYLEIVLNRVQGLNRLIKDLFELTRLEERQISFNYSIFYLEDLINTLYERFIIDVEQAGLEFIIEKPKNTDISIFIDLDRIFQVFENIINNALKHTPQGGSITLSSSLENKTEVLFSITDTGSGICSKDLPYIFERFYKGKKTNDLKDKNTGLGLAITKELVEAHSGRIWVESTEGQGTSIYFTLPLYTNKI